jgi:hypothetical protein
MIWGEGAHDQVAEELAKWWQNLWDEHTGSRVVLVAVPPGWGRTTLLERFRQAAEDPAGPVGLVAWISGQQGSLAAQALSIREALAAAAQRRPGLAGLLDLDRATGRILLGRGLAGLFISGMAATASLLAMSLAVTAAGNAWDASPAGEQGAAARAARELARISVQIPAAVIIDDADQLDPDLGQALIRNLAERPDGQILVIAAAAPHSSLVQALAKDAGSALAGRVRMAEANPDMHYADRAALARHLLPGLPLAGTARIAHRTRTFAEVFAVAAPGGMLAELGPDTDPAAAVQAADTAVTAWLDQTAPSRQVVVLAWAGGALHISQAQQAMDVLGASAQDEDPRVTRTGTLVRLAGPLDIRTTEAAAGLAASQRQQLAAAVLDAAARIATVADAGPVERLVARQAAHHTRGDLADRTGLPAVQVALIRGLEQLGDPATAAHVTESALAELPPGDSAERRDLLAAVLRLAHTSPGHRDDPAVEEAIALALAGGASLRLEARVWAAVDLLNGGDSRQDGLALARAVTADLAGPAVTGAAVAQWRMLLAFHAGNAGDQALAQQLLAPLITRGTTDQQKAAHAILRATTGPHAGTQLLPPGPPPRPARTHPPPAGPAGASIPAATFLYR